MAGLDGRCTRTGLIEAENVSEMRERPNLIKVSLSQPCELLGSGAQIIEAV